MRTFSGKLFNRTVAVSTVCPPMETELQALARSGNVTERAIGANLESDWRVSPARADYLCRTLYGVPPPEPPELGSGLKTFFRDRIRGQDVPDFLQPHNKANRRPLHEKVELVNVFCMPRDANLIRKPAERASLPIPASDREAEALIAELFPSVAASLPFNRIQEIFLDEFFEQASLKFHPVWAGLWTQARSFIHASPDLWLSSFGVRSEKSRLCLLMKYPRKCVEGPIFLPTFLESNANADHFANPPCRWVAGSEKRSGGHPASLSSASDPGELLSEFIHRDFRRSSKMVASWGWSSTGLHQYSLQTAREYHHARLGGCYAGVQDWLSEPI